MTLRDALVDLVMERSTLTRLAITAEELQSWAGGKINDYDRIYLGRYSVTIMTTMTKLVRADVYPCPPGDLAREYLRLVYEPGARYQSRSGGSGFSWAPPLYAEPVRSSHLAYVDLVHAYWQLVTPWRPDDFPLSHGKCVPGVLEWIDPDGVDADRALRHAVVGCIFTDKLTVWQRGKPTIYPVTSKWSNPALQRMAMQTLHALAGEVRDRFGLHAWLTDAAIVDADKADDLIDWLVLTWQIGARIVAYGPGAVYHETCHEVGDKRTMDLVNGTVTPRTAPRRSFTNLQHVDTDALRRARLERLGDGRGSVTAERM